MTLQDIYDQLAYGELRLTSLARQNVDQQHEEIETDNFKKLLPHIQLALTALHKRFFLREGRMRIQLVEGKVSYVIGKKYCESNTASSEPVKYILDAEEPYQNDLMKIERVYGRYLDSVYEIPLNQRDATGGVRTPSYTTLIVPDDVDQAPWLNETTELELVYRADHPAINKNVANVAPMVTEIHLPSMYLEALLYHVASRFMNATGTIQGDTNFHEGNNYMQRYEMECAKLAEINVQIDQDETNQKLYMRGFV